MRDIPDSLIYYPIRSKRPPTNFLAKYVCQNIPIAPLHVLILTKMGLSSPDPELSSLDESLKTESSFRSTGSIAEVVPMTRTLREDASNTFCLLQICNTRIFYLLPPLLLQPPSYLTANFFPTPQLQPLPFNSGLESLSLYAFTVDYVDDIITGPGNQSFFIITQSLGIDFIRM